jgi:hypothetical protein
MKKIVEELLFLNKLKQLFIEKQKDQKKATS